MEAEVYIHNPKKFTRLEMDADRVNLIAGFSYDETLQQYSLVSLTNKTIELVSDSITLTADKVYINGTTTFDSLFTSGTTTIDGSKITTGTITADELNVSTLSSISSNLGNITGGSINIGSGTFTVDSNGIVNASYMNISGGKIDLFANYSTIQPFRIQASERSDGYEHISDIEMIMSQYLTSIRVSERTTDESVVDNFYNNYSQVNPGSLMIGKTYWDNSTRLFDLIRIRESYMSINHSNNDSTGGTWTTRLHYYDRSVMESETSGTRRDIYLPFANGTIALTSDITTALADYSTSTEVTSEINTALADYSTSTEVTSEINTALTNYPTTTQMNTALAGYQGKTWTSISPTTVPVNSTEVMFELRYTTSQGRVQRTFTIIPTVLLKAVNSSYTQTIYIGDRATFGGVVTYSYSSASSYFNFSKTVYYNGSSVSGILFAYYR